MAEYIDREELLTHQYNASHSNWPQLAEMVVGVEDIEDAPAADVAPVVLGHWKKDRDTIKCTVCGFGMFPNRYTFMHGVCVTDKKLPKYCENCGAKMGTTEEQSV
jgi:hypothetical protein